MYYDYFIIFIYGVKLIYQTSYQNSFSSTSKAVSKAKADKSRFISEAELYQTDPKSGIIPLFTLI